MALNLAPILDQLSERNRERGAEMHVATMTLVVLFEDETIGKLARDRIRMLASKHPSRVVVLDACRDERVAHVENNDWIEIGAKGAKPQALRDWVCALHIRDAPIVLLWIASGIGEDSRFAMLSELAETIVYNSSLVDNGHAALCELFEYIEQHPHLPLADVAYLRLVPWQECVATFFDGKDADELRDVRHVEVACGSEPEGFYLLGWLASRLQWTATSADALLDRESKTVTFQMRLEGEPRRVRRVALATSSSQYVAEIDESGETILLNVSGSSRHGQRYRAIKNPGIAALLEHAILWSRNDRVFQHALAAAGQILACRKD
jgi:glucose-6-phosphate dehydrogenase assembly protein OpcA